MLAAAASVALVAVPALPATALPATAPPATRPGALPATTHRAATGDLPVTVEVTGLSPTTLTPGGSLTVTGRLVNAGDRALRGLRVDVRIRPDRLADRAAVAAWADGASTVLGQVELGARVRGRLDPGESVAFQVRGDVADFDLPGGSASFGPRGVTVQAIGTAVPADGRDAGPAAVVGERRTFTVWNPEQAPPTTRVGILVPLVAARPTSDVSQPQAGTLAELAPTGRLGRLVGVGGQTAGLSWAVDPGLLLAAARATGTDGGTDPADVLVSAATGTASPSGAATAGRRTAPDTSTPAGTDDPATDDPTAGGADVIGAGEWLDALRSVPDTQDLWTLPFGDPDLAALAHGRQALTLRTALSMGRDAARLALDRTSASTLAWPAGGFADAATARLVEGAGLTDLVLSQQSQPSTGPSGLTAAPRSVVTAGDGTVAGLVTDDDLSAVLTTAGEANGAAARQRLVAELAALAREDRSVSAAVVLAAPRDWDVDATALSATLAALGGTSWLRITTASELGRAAPARTASRTLVYPESARRAELPQQSLEAVADARRRLGDFAAALADPDPVVVPLRREALSLAGVAWRGDGDLLAARAADLARDVDALYAGIGVPQGSDKLLLARTGELPLTVENRLAVPVEVVVALRPRSGRLVAVEPVTVQIPARGRANALVPVRAIADGNVLVEVSLFTPGLKPIAASTFLDVRVRSDWEGRGVAAVAGALALLLVVGLFRGVRRGRRPSVPPESVPDPDDVGRVLVDDDGTVLEPLAPDTPTAADR